MRIALAGLGNVGAAVLRIIRANGHALKQRGQEMTVAAVSARARNKKRDCDLTAIEWVEDPRDLATRRDVDVVVEAIGGAEGIALDLAHAAFKNGKHLVTANKAMIAAHGVDLARAAEKAGLQLSFEAAVCGGVPVLKMLREGMAANKISSVRGILNGTSNYILTRMTESGIAFDAALREAQQQGCAEADPAADIDGIDAASKLAILSALAFGIAPDMSSVFVEGIRSLSPQDLGDAVARGGRIKLLGIATREQSAIVQRVQPVFVPLNETLSRVDGVANAIEITGDFAGPMLIQGIGAGGNATASAIIADLIDLARGHRSFAFGVSADELVSGLN